MITFGGAALEDIAPVRALSIEVHAPQITHTAYARVLSPGAQLTLSQTGPRRVEIRFVLIDGDMNRAASHMMRIGEWASGGIKPLTLPGFDGVHLAAACEQLPSIKMTRPYGADALLTFTAFDPCWRADGEKSAPAGEIFVLGSAPPIMRLTCRADAAGDVVWSDGVVETRFIGVPAGEMTIDLSERTATVDGVSVMNRFDPTSGFIQPRAGRSAITGPGQIVWRERWL